MASEVAALARVAVAEVAREMEGQAAVAMGEGVAAVAAMAGVALGLAAKAALAVTVQVWRAKTAVHPVVQAEEGAMAAEVEGLGLMGTGNTVVMEEEEACMEVAAVVEAVPVVSVVPRAVSAAARLEFQGGGMVRVIGAEAAMAAEQVVAAATEAEALGAEGREEEAWVAAGTVAVARQVVVLLEASAAGVRAEVALEVVGKVAAAEGLVETAVG